MWGPWTCVPNSVCVCVYIYLFIFLRSVWALQTHWSLPVLKIIRLDSHYPPRTIHESRQRHNTPEVRKAWMKANSAHRGSLLHSSALTASLGAQMVKNLPAVQETWIWSLGWKIPWRREWHPTPGFLPGEFHGQRSLVGDSPWVHKESDVTSFISLSSNRSRSRAPGKSRILQWSVSPSLTLHSIGSCSFGSCKAGVLWNWPAWAGTHPAYSALTSLTAAPGGRQLLPNAGTRE